MIITGGEKVYPSEVEQALGGHPDVREVAVIGVPDPKWGEAVMAVVVPRPLIENARTRLAGYKCPRAVAFIRDEEMPRTATGKILHRLLRDRFGGARAS